MVKCYSIISGKYGEHVFPHIVFEGTSFNVGDEVFHTNMLGRINTGTTELKKKGTRPTLISFDLDDKNCRTNVLPKSINGRKVEALVFLRGPSKHTVDEENAKRLYTNLRVPLPLEYWKRFGEIERSGSDIAQKKAELKQEYSFSYDIRSSGAQIILPEERPVNRSSYLVALTNDGEFEWVLSRKSKYPNTYRIEFDGHLKFVDPRKEARQ